jgi:ribosomal protein L11 methylase PrmA
MCHLSGRRSNQSQESQTDIVTDKTAGFGEGHARCYDLLYTDKDYAGEAAFVAHLLEHYAPGSTTLLELGCGSGIHAGMLAERGYQVSRQRRT